MVNNEETKKTDATDAKDDAQKANKLEGEAKKDKDKENGDTINKENNETPSLEDEVARVRDNTFLAQNIVETKTTLKNIENMLKDLMGLDKSITDAKLLGKNKEDPEAPENKDKVWIND